MELTARRAFAAAFCPKETASEATAFFGAALIDRKVSRFVLLVKFRLQFRAFRLQQIQSVSAARLMRRLGKLTEPRRGSLGNIQEKDPPAAGRA